jgi:glutamine synthetase
MMKKIEPGEPAVGELDDHEYAIRSTLDEALTLFEAADVVREVLGENFCMIYGEIKREEMRLFHREISPWEREHLLLNV